MSNSTSSFHLSQTEVFRDPSLLTTNKLPIITRQLAFNNSIDNILYTSPEVDFVNEVNLNNENLLRSIPNINSTSQTSEIQDKKTSKDKNKK